MPVTSEVPSTLDAAPSSTLPLALRHAAPSRRCYPNPDDTDTRPTTRPADPPSSPADPARLRPAPFNTYPRPTTDPEPRAPPRPTPPAAAAFPPTPRDADDPAALSPPPCNVPAPALTTNPNASISDPTAAPPSPSSAATPAADTRQEVADQTDQTDSAELTDNADMTDVADPSDEPAAPITTAVVNPNITSAATVIDKPSSVSTALDNVNPPQSQGFTGDAQQQWLALPPRQRELLLQRSQAKQGGSALASGMTGTSTSATWITTAGRMGAGNDGGSATLVVPGVTQGEAATPSSNEKNAPPRKRGPARETVAMGTGVSNGTIGGPGGNSSARTCGNCGLSQTRQWVRGEGMCWLCHSCGQFWRKNGYARPRALWNRPTFKRSSRKGRTTVTPPVESGSARKRKGRPPKSDKDGVSSNFLIGKKLVECEEKLPPMPGLPVSNRYRRLIRIPPKMDGFAHGTAVATPEKMDVDALPAEMTAPPVVAVATKVAAPAAMANATAEAVLSTSGALDSSCALATMASVGTYVDGAEADASEAAERPGTVDRATNASEHVDDDAGSSRGEDGVGEMECAGSGAGTGTGTGTETEAKPKTGGAAVSAVTTESGPATNDVETTKAEGAADGIATSNGSAEDETSGAGSGEGDGGGAAGCTDAGGGEDTDGEVVEGRGQKSEKESSKDGDSGNGLGLASMSMESRD